MSRTAGYLVRHRLCLVALWGPGPPGDDVNSACHCSSGERVASPLRSWRLFMSEPCTCHPTRESRERCNCSIAFRVSDFVLRHERRALVLGAAEHPWLMSSSQDSESKEADSMTTDE